MKTKLILKVAMALLSLTTLLQPSTVLAQGTAFTYQGRLDDGANPASGIYDLRFTIYDSSGGPTVIAGPVTNSPTSVSNGLFTVTVDFGGGVFTGADRWLDIGVRTNGGGAFTTLAPRQQLTPTPYAIFAGGAQSATTVAAGGVNSAALANGAVGSNAIADGSIAASDLSPGLLHDTFWRLGGNTGTTPGTHFLGTTDNQPLELKAHNVRALRIEPTATSPNLIGGHSGNAVAPGMDAVVIAGGGRAGAANYAGAELTAIGGGWANTNNGGGAFLGGGYLNRIESGALDAVLAGGRANFIQAGASQSTIGGGWINTLFSGASYSTISGGRSNVSYGAYTAIAGGHGNLVQTNATGATIGGGEFNSVLADSVYARIAGGRENRIESQAWYSSIAGGQMNVIQSLARNSAIGGGDSHRIESDTSSAVIGGGTQNRIQSQVTAGTIAGGWANVIGSNAYAATIGGGRANTVLTGGEYTTVAGGQGNNAWGIESVIGGGRDNRIGFGLPADHAVIGGGQQNLVYDDFATIGGGRSNTVLNMYGTISGGRRNEVLAWGGTIGGGEINTIGGTAENATIGGGGLNTIEMLCFRSTIAGGYENRIGSACQSATIGGGQYNGVISDAWYSVISGGADNYIRAVGSGGTIGGGQLNEIVGSFGTVPGGRNNRAASFAFAAGQYATATHPGSFVWSSRTNTAPSFAKNRFHVHAQEGLSVDYAEQRGDGGGQRWVVLGGYSDFSGQTISTWSGAHLTDGGVWTDNSDRNAKENFTPVNGREILERIAVLPVSSWNYKTEGADVRHIGPVAQDFYEAFRTGADDKHLAALDSAGVALAAIQGLNQKLEQKLEQKETEITELKQTVIELKELVQAMNQKLNGGAK